MYTRYGRSLLCTPAIDTSRYAACHGSGADICQVDLEDSIPLPRKEEARRRAAAFFDAEQPVRCAVRINAVTEADGLLDLLALREYPVPPSIVLVPKVESARDLEIVESVLGHHCPELELLAIIETPRGLDRVDTIATGSLRLRALIFGSADYASTLGIGLDWAPLAHARSRLVNSARAAGLEAIDSPCFDLADPTALRHEAELGRRLGFSGKIALHPKQVPVINEVFSPGAEELAHAARVVAAANRSGQGITTVGGAMVGRPFFEASQRLLDQFGHLDSADPADPTDSTVEAR